jgi:flagellar biosynthetic protein FlhB
LKGGANLEELTEKLKIFRISLQFFADTGDKTEQATPKRRSEARKKGQVVKSQEIVSSIVLLVSFIAMKTLGSSLYEKISGLTKTVFEVYMKDEDIFTIQGITKLTAELSIWFLQTMLPIFSLIMVMGVIANLMQSGFLFTLETIKPKFSNISPLGGIKNAFSFKSLLEFFSKALIKVVIVGIIAYTTIKDNIENIIGIMNFNVASIGQYIMAFSIDIGIKISAFLAIFSVADFIFQWRKHNKELMMTKQEIKEEYKQTEGNPQIKSKIRQKQRAMSLSRMMQQIPKADVVITNPTHFAVAIRYDPEKDSAPIVVAKGQDYVALRIKQVAKDHKIEIVENKPLARALFAQTEIGDTIPEELYQAVAEVLAYVYSLKAV